MPARIKTLIPGLRFYSRRYILMTLLTGYGRLLRGLNCNNCPAPVAKPNITTTYTITVKNNGGCSAEDNVTVLATCNSENIFIPNTFSPNGDGVNDIFYPRGTGLNRIRGMKIFNRWGELVFEKSNFYANDPLSGWDGLVKKFPRMCILL